MNGIMVQCPSCAADVEYDPDTRIQRCWRCTQAFYMEKEHGRAVI